MEWKSDKQSVRERDEVKYKNYGRKLKNKGKKL